MPSLEARIGLLREQQAAITQALVAMDEGRWVGEDSVEAWLLALNPTFEGQLRARPPLYDGKVDIPPPQNLKWIRSPNYWQGHGGYAPIAIVLHRMAGTLEGTDAWFSRTDSQVSAHFGIGLNGEQHQYVELRHSAWGNGIKEEGNSWPGAAGSPNYQTISIETEDNGSGSTPVTEEQYQATLEVANYVKQQYPTIRWLLRHTDISPHSRPDCCGARWIESGRFHALAERLNLKTTI